MDPRHLLFFDKRLTGMCVYCGAQPETRDHVPSRVLLDEPYPPFLPVVPACNSCNASFSLDEQYLACFLECVLCGTTEPAELQRSKISRTLSKSPALRHRINASQKIDDAGKVLWQPEISRVSKIILKLARGHVAYELFPIIEEPFEVFYAPLETLNHEQKVEFENILNGKLCSHWPEIGTRAFLRACGKNPDEFEQWGEWVVVQPGRYRYAVVETGGVLVKMVLSEYLACAVLWE